MTSNSWGSAAIRVRPIPTLSLSDGDAESDRVAAGSVPSRRGIDEDASLATSARAGDAAAFASLVERHQVRAHQVAWRVLRSAADAEEVAQDAFVRAWRALGAFRGEARFATWLHRIVVRLALDRLETLARRRREVGLEAAEHIGVSPAHRHVDREGLEAMIDSLSPVQQSAVRLYYYEDHSVATVAELLDLPENTVKTHLSRARAALRTAWLQKEGESR